MIDPRKKLLDCIFSDLNEGPSNQNDFVELFNHKLDKKTKASSVSNHKKFKNNDMKSIQQSDDCIKMMKRNRNNSDSFSGSNKLFDLNLNKKKT
jgi:hypothetical protein